MDTKKECARNVKKDTQKEFNRNQKRADVEYADASRSIRITDI